MPIYFIAVGNISIFYGDIALIKIHMLIFGEGRETARVESEKSDNQAGCKQANSLSRLPEESTPETPVIIPHYSGDSR